MIEYILKSSILLVALYTLYSIVLRKEFALNFNRAYLIVVLIISLAIPAISFDFLQISDAVITDNSILTNYQNNTYSNNQINVGEGIANLPFVSITKMAFLVYLLVAAILSIRFFANLYLLLTRITKNKNLQKFGGFYLIQTEQPLGIHSFYNTIFYGKNDFVNGKLDIDLLRHEKLHLKQKHFIDIIMIELLQIVYWFNPIILLYKKSIKENHEFLADRYVTQKSNSLVAYAQKIIEYTTKPSSITLASGFSFSSVKHRLEMINKPNNRAINKTKQLFVMLMATAIIMAFSAFSVLETKGVITKRKALKTIYKINKSTDYHNGSFTELEELASSANTNFNSFIIIAKLIQNFGHSTDPVMEIARIASKANTSSNLYNELVMLVFLEQTTSPQIYVDLALLVSQAKSEQELESIKNRIEQLKENTQFESIKIALKAEPN